MGMSTHVVGYQEADAKWQQMKDIWDGCEKANVAVPKEVQEFFDHVHPGDSPGREVDITACIEPWSDHYRDGFELDIAKLPKHVKRIRFYNAY